MTITTAPSRQLTPRLRDFLVAMADWTSGIRAAAPITSAATISSVGMLGERRSSGRRCLPVLGTDANSSSLQLLCRPQAGASTSPVGRDLFRRWAHDAPRQVAQGGDVPAGAGRRLRRADAVAGFTADELLDDAVL